MKDLIKNIIRNKLILSAVLFITVFSFSLYAVDRKYIPSDAEAVFSFNLDNLSKKAEADLQQVFNSLFMQRFADNFLELRDDESVAEAMTNRLAQLFDFSKDSKVIFLNNFRQLSIIVDILDIKELDKLMIKIASQEDKLISFSESGHYRYLELDEYTLISWNGEVFTVNLETYEVEDIINFSDSVFGKTALKNEYFISLENQTNDFYTWVDLSFLEKEDSPLTELLLQLFYVGQEDINNIKEIYKDGVLTGKINFNEGSADITFDTYLPNNNYDILSLRKELSDFLTETSNIFNFINGENNYGFLSLAFNSSALAKILGDIDYIGVFFDGELSSQLKEIGIDASQLFELLGGDIFISAWDTSDEETAILGTVSITEEKTVKTILEVLSDDKKGDIYIIAGDFYYIKDSVLYVVNNENVIDSIVNGEIVNTKFDKNKLESAKNNMFSFYFEFNTDLGLLYGLDKYIGEFESLYLTSNILHNNHSQTIIKLDMKDKTKNALITIKSLIEK